MRGSIHEIINNYPMVKHPQVYERCVFPGHTHHRIAALPGAWDRTITIGSGGKSFSTTGYKLGWALGPPDLIARAQSVHQTTVYSAPTILQGKKG